MDIHKNARLTPVLLRKKLALKSSRRENDVEDGCSRLQRQPKTAKWVRRYRTDGRARLEDRSSRPHRSPFRTRPELEHLRLRLSALLAFIAEFELAQIQLIDQVRDKIRQMVLWQPLAQTRRKQKVLLREIWAVDLHHASKFAASRSQLKLFVRDSYYYSDTLLEARLHARRGHSACASYPGLCTYSVMYAFLIGFSPSSARSLPR